jgi:predicted type IV restriction endonuclease
MGVEQELKQIQSRIEKGKTKEMNPYWIEENVRSQLLVPLLQSIGYDTNNPDEFLFEYPSGFKNSTKVDCVILKDGKDFFLIEVKNIQENLRLHIKQTQGYFNSSKTAKFALLTNVKEMMFFADFEHQNMMDDEPFYVIDIFNVTEEDMEFLQVFTKDNVMNHTEQVKHKAKEIKAYAQRERLNQEFIQMMKEKGLDVSLDMIQIKNPLLKTMVLESEKEINADKIIEPKELNEIDNGGGKKEKKQSFKFPKATVFGRMIEADKNKDFLKEFFELLIEKHPNEMKMMDKLYPAKKSPRFSYNLSDFTDAYGRNHVSLSNGLYTTHLFSKEALFEFCRKSLEVLGYQKEELKLEDYKETLL